MAKLKGEWLELLILRKSTRLLLLPPNETLWSKFADRFSAQLYTITDDLDMNVVFNRQFFRLITSNYRYLSLSPHTLWQN